MHYSKALALQRRRVCWELLVITQLVTEKVKSCLLNNGMLITKLHVSARSKGLEASRDANHQNIRQSGCRSPKYTSVLHQKEVEA